MKRHTIFRGFYGCMRCGRITCVVTLEFVDALEKMREKSATFIFCGECWQGSNCQKACAKR